MRSCVLTTSEVMAGGGATLVCGRDGELRAEEMHGLFASDTRLLSTYRYAIAGHSWQLLSRSRPDASTIQWDLQNRAIRATAIDLPAGTLHMRLRRTLQGALHDDVRIESFAADTIHVRLAIQIDADFSDLFEILHRSMPPRLSVARSMRGNTLTLSYQRSGFRRALHVLLTPSDGEAVVTGPQLMFDLGLAPHRPWTCCVHAVPEVDGERLEFTGDPHAGSAEESVPDTSLGIEAVPFLARPARRALADLEALGLYDEDVPFWAAGAPWYFALFGRDPLVTSLMAGITGSRRMAGTLEVLARFQAREEDPFRDAEPGKIPHELRRGELARAHRIPHTPYYGAHDAPALYILGLWNAVRWTGSRELLELHLPAALSALEWCEKWGDRDGDGLLEYATRSRLGYRNQSWKDSGDAVPHEDGALAEPPIAMVELQGYLFAARKAMADLLDQIGRENEAEAQRSLARELRQRIEERYWMEDAGFYALALDRDKRLVRSITSNPGHLLWCGVPSADRARQVADRLLEPELFTGYGVRTLASDHARYNPLSYQLGSVWPHDNALIASGLMRYGLREHAAWLLEGLLAAAQAHEESRLPELFCGFDREEGAPVPYEVANVPQAWAAATPLLALQLLLGLVPDAPRGRCYLDPWLPEWIPELEVRGIPVGNGTLDVKVRRCDGRTEVERAEHPSLELIGGVPEAALWGAPSD